MSRLEEIKDKYAPGKIITYNSAVDIYNTCRSDIEYLLNEVERLKGTLRLFSDKSNWMGKNKMEYPDMGIVEWDGEENPIKLAQETLNEPTPE